MEYQRVSAVFDYRGLRLLMGMIALLLPITVSSLAEMSLTSISASYYSNARDIFVGMLFVVGSFLFAYNGHTTTESVASKIASVAAVLVASFPTACDGCKTSVVSIVHYAAAAVLFSMLAYFCFVPFRRGIKNQGGKKARRSGIYLACGSVMVGCMIAIFIANQVLPKEIVMGLQVTYFGEAAALMAFGIAWIASGKAFRLIADEDEIYHPFRQQKSNVVERSLL